MSLVVKHTGFPAISRENFLTPFDRLFDSMMETSFPEIINMVGLRPFEGTAYPKVNVYEYDNKISVIAEIPGIDKKNLTVEVEDNILTIKGNKHGFMEDTDATVLRKELKHSAFERKFTLGESLDGEDIKASFKDGLLSVEIPKVEPEKPKRSFVKIS